MSDNDTDNEDAVTTAVAAALQPHMDDDTCEYISSLLQDDPTDADAREAVTALIEGALDETGDSDGGVDSVQLCRVFFELLDMSTSDNSQNDKEAASASASASASTSAVTTTTRRLEHAVTLSGLDVQSFASGLQADVDLTADIGTTGENGDEAPPVSKIAAFYATMIDVQHNYIAQSERVRRRLRQKELRERMEQEERQRAIEEAMAMFNVTPGNTNSENGKGEDATLDQTLQSDNAQDVHFRNLDLPNLRGGGENLLQDANITLARGKRYGLMGRNGCGKTTFMSFVASRQIPGAVPVNMNMLLVRQEIMGNGLSAVETVIQSDVQRESVRRFIAFTEGELERLEEYCANGSSGGTGTGGDQATTSKETTNGAVVTKASSSSGSKEPKGGKQKLRDRKRTIIQHAAREKAAVSVTGVISKQEMDSKRHKLNEKLALAYQRMAQIEEQEGGDPEPRARKVLAGLGFSQEMQDKPTEELSGGWRMRVSLSCALFASPSLLLLDEPTNHLDLEAVLWLEKYLTTKFTGTLMVVSHDRHFLNEIVTDVVHFHRSKLVTYRGDISNFEAVRDDDKLRQQRQREVQEMKRAHLQKYVDLHAQSGENGVKASKQRKSKMKKLDKLGVMAQDGKKWKASYDGEAEEVEEYQEEEAVTLNFPDPGLFDGDIVRLDQVQFGYSPDKLLLHEIDLTISMKSRAALLGRNGCGKSTLIKLVVGALQPLNGKVTIDARAKIEYLAQHQLEQLDPDGTPIQTMIDRYPGDHSNSHIGELRRYLANFGLGGEILPGQKIHTMSGGQKCRLCLACAMYRKPHLLILDEPTNHLDLETTEALIEAIRTFQGGVLLVSHDQHLLTSVCKDLYVVEKGKVERLEGGLSNDHAFKAYKKGVIAGRR